MFRVEDLFYSGGVVRLGGDLNEPDTSACSIWVVCDDIREGEQIVFDA